MRLNFAAFTEDKHLKLKERELELHRKLNFYFTF